MLALISCILGLLLLLIIAEVIGKKKLLKGEYHRKFLHITAGTFIAFWPWIITWQQIQILGLVLASGMLASHYLNFLDYRGKIGRATYGDIFYALAIFITANMTQNPYFFAIAIAIVAIADGFAAVIGVNYLKNWSYSVLNQKKTIIGSMVFWILTVCILGAGLLFGHAYFTQQTYFVLILLLPPLLTLVENLSVYGLDNLLIPILTVAILQATQI